MIEKRFLKCGAAAVFLFGFAQACLAADAPSASAAPTTAIHAPTSDWTVGQLTTMNTNGLGYCSMKNNFQTGQSLVFARDDQGSNSIALDFHRNIFTSGELYSVKARVGSVIRRIDALAATRQVLVMQTGIDTEFYGALAHKHNVVFTINKTNYGFELDASAADALNALRHCSESFQSGTQFSQTTFPLGKVSDVAALEQDDEADNIAAIANDEQPARAEKKHHQHKHVARTKAAAPAEAQQEAAAVPSAPAVPATVVISGEQQPVVEASAAAPSPSQQDTVRDDVKAEIASEIINLRTNEQQSQSSSKSSLPGIMPAAGGNTASPALAPIRMSSSENADLRNLLQRSRVASGQQIQATANGTLRWTSDDLYGSARQMPLAPGQSLTDVANEYLNKAASVCKGEFAKKMGAVQKAGQVDVLNADITCLDGQNNAAAAVLFIGNPDGRVSVITQEGTIDQLTSAMSARDAIISAAARGGKRASNDLGILHGHDPGLPDTPQADHKLASADTGPPINLSEQTSSPPPPASLPPVSQQNIPPQIASASPPSRTFLPPHSSPSPPPSADTLALLTPSAGYQQQSSPQQISLATQMGTEFGVDISNYKYREDTDTVSPFVNISGTMPGIEGSFTAPVPAYGWYIRAEGRAAYGADDYSSASGTQKGRSNELGEVRGLAGTDYIFDNFALSPYTGYGFRYLYDDGRGLTSLGGSGYRRISHYQYIPVGLIDRYRIMDQSRISTDLEYDFFTGGTQRSYTNDFNPAWGDTLNHQGSGHGMKGSVLFEMGGWLVGPWFDYWHIGQSNLVIVPGSIVGPLAEFSMEPDNKTTEIGFKITKQVW